MWPESKSRAGRVRTNLVTPVILRDLGQSKEGRHFLILFSLQTSALNKVVEHSIILKLKRKL